MYNSKMIKHTQSIDCYIVYLDRASLCQKTPEDLCMQHGFNHISILHRSHVLQRPNTKPDIFMVQREEGSARVREYERGFSVVAELASL
jgi:hypothetical protein